jgi:hypothetical protein
MQVLKFKDRIRSETNGLKIEDLRDKLSLSYKGIMNIKDIKLVNVNFV